MMKSFRVRTLLKSFTLLTMAGACAALAHAASNKVDISKDGDKLVIQSNGIADHAVGLFPNKNNPHRISEQRHRFVIDATPRKAGRFTQMKGSAFGVALNGVPLDPSAAEFYKRDRQSGWSYDPFKMPGRLGLDQNNAHVQPNGAYHYHGVPTGLISSSKQHSPLIGYAADGFPVYAQFGYSDGIVVEQTSSYRLKSGTRPSGPKGKYDGTFVEDWEYAKNAGSLDQCNGKDTVTPEFPNRTYAYFITDEFPYIPRCWVGKPSRVGFQKKQRR